MTYLFCGTHSVLREEPGRRRERFDYCVVAAGCNFGMFHPKGESLWFPTVWEDTRAVSSWKQHDERYWDGRLAHIVEECQRDWTAGRPAH